MHGFTLITILLSACFSSYVLQFTFL